MYHARNPALTPNGQTILKVQTNNDNLFENDGSVTARLVARTGYTIDSDNAEGTIIVTDNDLPEVFLSEIDTENDFLTYLPILEGNPVTFELKRVGDLLEELEVHLNLTRLDGTVEQLGKTFAANKDTALVVVTTMENEVMEEAHRSISLTITADEQYNIRSEHGTLSVLVPDDDFEVFLKREDLDLDSVAEGQARRYNLKLSRNGDVSLPLKDVQLSAHSDERMVRPAGRWTIGAGQTSRPVIIDDNVDEDTETFTVSLREPLYARLTGGEQIATGTIDDNDPVTKSGAPM